MRPSFMVRLGDLNCHFCHSSPPQLFNLAVDPDEWTILAGDPSVAGIEATPDRIISGGDLHLHRIARDV